MEILSYHCAPCGHVGKFREKLVEKSLNLQRSKLFVSRKPRVSYARTSSILASLGFSDEDDFSVKSINQEEGSRLLNALEGVQMVDSVALSENYNSYVIGRDVVARNVSQSGEFDSKVLIQGLPNELDGECSASISSCFWEWKPKLNVHYEKSGCKNVGSPAVLFLPGFGVGSFHYEKQLKDLGREFRVWAMDFVGQGMSLPFEDPTPQSKEMGISEENNVMWGFGDETEPWANELVYSIDLWQDQVRHFIEQVIGEPVYIVGNSLGGFVALYFAACNPQLVKGVTLLNATPFWGFLPNPIRSPRLAKIFPWAGTFPLPPPVRKITEFIWQKISDPETIGDILKQVYADHSTNVDNVFSRILDITQHPAAAASFASIMCAPHGSLRVLGNLDNLVTLDISYNNFSGFLPDTKLFQDLPAAIFYGNRELCIDRNKCQESGFLHDNTSTRNLIFCIVLGIILTVLIMTVGVISIFRSRTAAFGRNNEEDGLDWYFIPFQKLSFSVNDIVTRLSDSSIVGKGSSGVVYRVETPMKQVIAVKKLWPIKDGEIPERDMFSAEVQTLGSIRHKNIVRLLGCCNNGKTRLLLFDYISNGSLFGLLHEKKMFLDWDARYKILLGAAHGLAYLHHDCIPPIVHRDVKANNILVGQQFQAFLADFGLAKLVDSSECSRASNTVAGSYGYIAPEYGYSLRITEKSDVYSYGVVVLEALTGMEPADRRIPEGAHIVSWVNHKLREAKREFTSILDKQLVLQSGTQIQEMLQVLGVAILCVNPSPDERPTMNDVAAMLKEIRQENGEFEKPNLQGDGAVVNQKTPVHSSSFSKSSETPLRSPSLLP